MQRGQRTARAHLVPLGPDYKYAVQTSIIISRRSSKQVRVRVNRLDIVLD